jgi:hypothetical protein
MQKKLEKGFLFALNHGFLLQGHLRLPSEIVCNFTGHRMAASSTGRGHRECLDRIYKPALVRHEFRLHIILVCRLLCVRFNCSVSV